MKSVKIQYFAILREQAQLNDESLRVDCGTYAELYNFLRDKHGFTLPPEMIQVAANDEFVLLDSQIHDGANVVFIPPVAGG